MTSNTITELKVRVRNIGHSVWPAMGLSDGKFKINLGFHWFDEKGERIILWDGLRTSLPYDVQPNEAVILNAAVGPPETPGEYVLEFDLVQEMVTWFKQKGSKTLRMNMNVYI